MGDEKKVDFLTVEEVAEVLGVNVRTVWRYDKELKIPKAQQFGRAKKWLRSDIVLWLDYNRPGRKAFEFIKEKG